MIHTSSFPFDGSTTWKPEDLRKILNIPGDQSKILNSLPEWLKDDSSSNSSKASVSLNSQCSQITPTVLSESQHYKKKVELFNKYLEVYKTTFPACAIDTRRRHKSSSVIEFDSGSKDLQHSALKRTLSVPDINLETGNFLAEETFGINKEAVFNKTYTLSSIYQSKNQIVFKSKDPTAILSDKPNILHDKSSKELFANLKPSCKEMEIVAEIPVGITNAEKVLSNGVKFGKVIEKSHPEPPEKICSSPNIDESKEVTSVVNAQIEAPDGKSSGFACDKVESESVIQPKVLENNVSEGNIVNVSVPDKAGESVSVIHPKVIENNGSKDSEKNLNAEHVVMSNNLVPSKLIGTAKEDLKISESPYANHTPSSNCVGNGSKDAKDSSKIVVIEETQFPRQDLSVSNISDAKSANAEATVAVKRKAESKKSLKKRKSFVDKKNDPRSIKRAGEITYSSNEIRTMLDLVQKFL